MKRLIYKYIHPDTKECYSQYEIKFPDKDNHLWPYGDEDEYIREIVVKPEDLLL